MRTTSSGTSESSTASAQTRPSERSWYFPDVLVINSTQQRLALLRCTTRSLRRAHSRSAISPSAITCGSVVPVHSPRSHTVDLWPTSRFTGDQGHIEVPLDSAQAEVNEAESKKLHCSVQIAGYDRSPALVAQLDRAPDYGSGGWGFESLQARRTNPPPPAGDFLVF